MAMKFKTRQIGNHNHKGLGENAPGNNPNLVPYTGAYATVNLNDQTLSNVKRLGAGTATPLAPLHVVSEGANTVPSLVCDHNGCVFLVTSMGTTNGSQLFYNAAGRLGAFIQSTTPSMFLGGLGVGIRTANAASKYKGLTALGGIEVYDLTDAVYGAEILANTALTSGTSWTVSGDAALASDKATFAYSSGTSTYINQTAASFAGTLAANTLHVLSVDMSNVVVPACTAPPSLVINTGETLSAFSVRTETGALIYFKTGTTVTQFRLTLSGWATGMSFDLDNISLKAITCSGRIKTLNDLIIETGTDKTMVLSEPVYKDDNAGGLVLVTGGTLPGIVNLKDNTGADTGIPLRGFAIGESGSVTTEFQHDGLQDSPIIFHVHFSIQDAPTGTDYVKWQIKYTIQRDGVTTPAATTITKEVAVTTQYMQYRADFDQIDIADLHIGDQISYILERVTATGDAFAGECLLKTVGYHYPIDTMGSRTVGVK